MPLGDEGDCTDAAAGDPADALLLDEGEIFGFLGPNDAGKGTTVRRLTPDRAQACSSGRGGDLPDELAEGGEVGRDVGVSRGQRHRRPGGADRLPDTAVGEVDTQ